MHLISETENSDSETMTTNRAGLTQRNAMSSQTSLVFILALLCAAEASLLDGMVQDKPRNVAKAQSQVRDSVEQEGSGEIQRPALLSGIGGIKQHEVIKTSGESSEDDGKSENNEEQSKQDGEAHVQNDEIADQSKASESGHVEALNEEIDALEPSNEKPDAIQPVADGDFQEDSKLVGHIVV